MKNLFRLICSMMLIICNQNYANSPVHCEVNQALQMFDQAQKVTPKIIEFLDECDKTSPNDVQVLLLHGLLARKEGLKSQHYETAIAWFQKAVKQAAPDNSSPALELAVTYQWAKQNDKANEIYKKLLEKNPQLRPALIGSAYVAIAQNHLDYAKKVFQNLLQQNASDVDALNGLGRVDLIEKNFVGAKLNFEKALKIKPGNQDSVTGLAQLNQAIKPQSVPAPVSCQSIDGLRLMAQSSLPQDKITKILQHCDKTMPNDVNTLLLHGLLSRREGLVNKRFDNAIAWFKKAVAVAAVSNDIPRLELAVTYEWAGQPDKAKVLYEAVLKKMPENRAALLGVASVSLAQNHITDAESIYRKFLHDNANDIDALNGLGRVALAKNDKIKAKQFFEKVLKLDPNNKDARIGLKQASVASVVIKPVSLCGVDEGLKLLNLKDVPFNKIQIVLNKCDKVMPNDVQVLLLHGLLARKKGMPQNDYMDAISWLKKAAFAAGSKNDVPLLELATTYEWNDEADKAKAIYQYILRKNPTNRAALLGMASVDRKEYKFTQANQIYGFFLNKNPRDIDALIGVGAINLANKDFFAARQNYQSAQMIEPNNTDAAIGLQMLAKAVRNRLSVFQGIYGIAPKTSDSTGINYVRDVNATDQFLLSLAHNSSEIQFGFFDTPTFLPKNRVLVGFQRQYYQRYGWGGNFDYREHVNQGTEYHAEINANVFLIPKFQIFGGLRESFPTPFNYQLYWMGATAYTDLPFNVSLTRYEGIQEIPVIGIIHSPAYSLDLSKELSDRTYYDIGAAYLTSQKIKWSVHGNFVLTTFENQAIEAWCEYYWFNNSYFGGLGWRFYW